jgi:molybdopterin converting factor small subunit
MSVRIRLFAAYREAAGTGCLDLPSEDGLTVERLWDRMTDKYPGLARRPSAAAVNLTCVPLDTEVEDGDEVAFLPPVGGG